MIPDHLLLDCSEEIKKFSNVVCEIDMPVVDMSAALDQVVLAISNLNTSIVTLNEVAEWMANSEGLFENADLDNGQHERLYSSVCLLGEGLIVKFDQYGLYCNNELFPYVFKELIDDGTILFKKQPKSN